MWLMFKQLLYIPWIPCRSLNLIPFECITVILNHPNYREFLNIVTAKNTNSNTCQINQNREIKPPKRTASIYIRKLMNSKSSTILMLPWTLYYKYHHPPGEGRRIFRLQGKLKTSWARKFRRKCNHFSSNKLLVVRLFTLRRRSKIFLRWISLNSVYFALSLSLWLSFIYLLRYYVCVRSSPSNLVGHIFAPPDH